MSVSVPDLDPRADLSPTATVRTVVTWPGEHAPSPRMGDHVLSEDAFKDAVRREWKRAERLGPAFAVAVVTCDGADAVHPRWGSILRAAAAAKRDVDIEGWLDHGKALGLLMPDVSAQGARRVTARIRREIAERLGERSLHDLSIRLYGLGGEAEADGTGLMPVDALLQDVDGGHHRVRDATKRAVDVVGSLVLLTVFAPVMLAVFVAVRWTSLGPALYRQVRIGQRGRPFTMLKFRTMRADADHGIHQDYVTWFITSSGSQPRTGHEVFKLTQDPRITPIGCLLRKTSLDELPQFWNVLRGEMSLVGPRPPLPFEVDHYQPWHRRRILEAKPGVTGPWQVYGRSRTTFDEMVRLDLHYARTHTLWTDLRILLATPVAMITGKGAC